MERVCEIVAIATLGILCWQDFRSRLISGWLLLLLAIFFFFSGLCENSAIVIGKNFSLNILFLLLQFIFISVYFTIKKKRFMNIVDKQIGAGDLLFLLTIALAFSPINFFLFYTSALVLTLVVTILVNLFRKQTRKEIPLAGALALPLIGLCFWKLIDPAKNFYNDEWIMNILYNT